MALLKNFARIFMLAVSFILLLNCPVLLAYTQEKIQIAYPGVTLLILPLMIGEEMGLFKDEGLDVTAVQMRTSIEMQALTSGYVDYAMAAGTGIVAAAKGLEVAVIAVNVNRPPHVLISLSRFNDVRGLKGQVIGSGTFGSTYYVTREVLRTSGLDPDKDIKWLPVGQTPERLQLLSKGLIAATPLSPPDSILAKKMGFKELVRSSPLVEFPFNGYVTTAKKLRQNPEQVKRLLRADLKALRWIHGGGNPDRVIRVIMKRLKLDHETARASLEAMKESFSKNGEISEAGIRFVFKMAHDAGQIGREPRISDVLDFGLLRQAQNEVRVSK